MQAKHLKNALLDNLCEAGKIILKGRGKKKSD